MKLSIALLASLGGVGAFVPSRTSSVARPHHPPAADASSGAIVTTTSLNQFGTLGFDTNNLYSREEVETMRTQNEIIGFLGETQRPNTALRPDLGTTVLISGFDPTDPSSTEILDFLNSEDSPHFPFSRIIAHCEDVKVARKRLIGRNARYTGLLDKLTFSEGASSPIPTAEQLAGVSSWVAHVGGGDIARVADVADAAEGAESVKNVAILVSGATGVGGDALRGIEEMLKSKATTFAYTLLVVPEWNDEPEALCAFGIVNATDVGDSPFATGETFSREESLRIITECLAIDRAAGKCVVANAAKDANSLENMLIHGMREIGFSRIQEIEYMVTMGAKVRACGLSTVCDMSRQIWAHRPLTAFFFSIVDNNLPRATMTQLPPRIPTPHGRRYRMRLRKKRPRRPELRRSRSSSTVKIERRPRSRRS
jgi:hypothetical protein